jgi:hypothetical protein
MSATPKHLLVDSRGRPYFLWDLDMDVDSFQRALQGHHRGIRAYFAAKLMRQAKPDDVFQFLSLAEIRDLWPEIKSYLGQKRPFWTWLLAGWKVIPREEG